MELVVEFKDDESGHIEILMDGGDTATIKIIVRWVIISDLLVFCKKCMVHLRGLQISTGSANNTDLLLACQVMLELQYPSGRSS